MKVWGIVLLIVLLILVFSLCLGEEKEKTITGEKEPEESMIKEISTPKQDQTITESFTPIEKARNLLGETVIIKGTVTVPPGVFRDDIMYIQDSTGGIKVYSKLLSELGIKLGDIVRIEGVIDRYYDNIEIKFLKNEKISIIGNETPFPLSLSIKEAKNREGSFVKIEGTVTKIYKNNFYIEDGEDIIKVYIDKDTGISINVKTGDKVEISGVISKYKGEIEILPRYKTDIIEKEK